MPIRKSTIQRQFREARKLATIKRNLADTATSKVAYCSTCKAPVLDSLLGWDKHFARSPKCGVDL